MSAIHTSSHAAAGAQHDNRSKPMADGSAPLELRSPGGPLVAVCGLQGGAGTSILANLLAEAAAARDGGRVVLVEAPGATGNQAALIATTSAVSLAELSVAVAAGRTPPRFWGEHGRLRVIATSPQPTPPLLGAGELGDLLTAARAEHALTVVDAGTARDPHARAILAAATHVLWTLRLDAGAVEQARALLASRLVPALAARQAFAVRAGRARERFAGQGPALRQLVADHSARLVLVPDLPARDARADPDSARARRLIDALTRFFAERCAA